MFGSSVPVLLVQQANAMQLITNTATGATLPAGSMIVMAGMREHRRATLHSSRTVSVTRERPRAR